MTTSSLYLGDCLSIMRGLAEASVDAIVTDPPYELGFMGRKWDSTGIAYNVLLWAEVLRVLKPGGHLLAFGGTRTYHRMTCAIEDAGFEIRDSLHWMYGCLSEDTELLTENGWMPYHKASVNNLALGYNVDKQTYEWMPIQEVLVYDYCDTAFHLRSDHTDQLVSRNHRCLVERGGKFVFQYAETLQSEARVPILENLPSLLKALSVSDEGAGIAEYDVRPCLCKPEDGCRAAQAAPSSLSGRSGLLGLRERHPEAQGQDSGKPDLFPAVQRGPARTGLGQARSQGSGGANSGGNGILSPEDERAEKSGVEGRRDLLSQTRQLPGNQVCPLSGGTYKHGTAGRICHGASPVCGASAGEAAFALGSGPPQGSQPDEQYPEQPSAICQQQRSQEARGEGHTRADLVTVTPVEYEGKVWCIRVRSGAFVARRNGRVFVTGNSGFPKSLDVSKQIGSQEKNTCLNVCKAIDNIPKNGILEIWKDFSSNVKSAGVTFRKNATGTGTSTSKSGFALTPVALSVSPKNPYADAILAELNSSEALLMLAEPTSFAQQNVALGFTVLSGPASSAAYLPESPDAMQSTEHSSVRHGAWDLLAVNMASRIKAGEALKTWLGKKPSSRQAASNALCAALESDLKGIILSQSKTFLSLDMTSQTAFASAMTVIITEYTAASLISFMVATLRNESLDVAKAIDKAQGHWRGRASGPALPNAAMSGGNYGRTDKGEPVTPAAAEWQGWGTALKPAHEPIVLARKPLSEATVAANVLRWGTGALNIDAGRIPTSGETPTGSGLPGAGVDKYAIMPGRGGGNGGNQTHPQGRWPANVLLDEDAAAELDAQSGSAGSTLKKSYINQKAQSPNGIYSPRGNRTVSGFGDCGGASRFFYVAKPSPKERNAGCDALPVRPAGGLEGRSDGSLGSVTGALRLRSDLTVEQRQFVMRELGAAGVRL